MVSRAGPSLPERRAMIEALTLLFLCQLAGEALVRLSGLAFPGPVLGMALLAGLLALRGGIAAELDALADTILKNLSLLFVPAAVGVIQQVDLIAAHWLAIAAAVLGSTLLTLAVTVLVFRATARALGQ
jgi:holin-like protein